LSLRLLLLFMFMFLFVCSLRLVLLRCFDHHFKKTYKKFGFFWSRTGFFSLFLLRGKYHCRQGNIRIYFPAILCSYTSSCRK
jgi:hypothetical protein